MSNSKVNSYTVFSLLLFIAIIAIIAATVRFYCFPRLVQTHRKDNLCVELYSDWTLRVLDGDDVYVEKIPPRRSVHPSKLEVLIDTNKQVVEVCRPEWAPIFGAEGWEVGLCDFCLIAKFKKGRIRMCNRIGEPFEVDGAAVKMLKFVQRIAVAEKISDLASVWPLENLELIHYSGGFGRDEMNFFAKIERPIDLNLCDADFSKLKNSDKHLSFPGAKIVFAPKDVVSKIRAPDGIVKICTGKSYLKD